MASLAGAGGLLTTGEDMLKLTQMLIRPEGQWVDVMSEATTPLAKINETTLISYGIESYSNEEDLVYAKSGGQMGYGSYVAWVPSLDFAIFIFVNQGGTRFLKSTVESIIDEVQNRKD